MNTLFTNNPADRTTANMHTTHGTVGLRVNNSVNKTWVFITALLLIILVGISAPLTRAYHTNPVTIEYTGQPGDTVKGQLTVVNNTNEPQVLYLKSESSNNDEDAMNNWIELSAKEVTLKPNERKLIPYKINIPIQAPAGTHEAAIVADSDIHDAISVFEDTTLHIHVTHLISLNIVGNITSDINLEEFLVKDGTITEDYPQFEIIFNNLGSKDERFEAIIEVRDANNNVVSESDLNKDDEPIPANNTKRYATPCRLNEVGPGVYRAILKGYLVENDVPVDAEIVFEITEDRRHVILGTRLNDVNLETLHGSAQPVPDIDTTITAITFLIMAIAFAFGIKLGYSFIQEHLLNKK